MTKHDAMKAYFEPKVMELVQDRLGFNFSPESPDSVAFITNYSDKVRKKYIRIGAEKEYGFSILITKAYSTASDDLNLEAMNFAQGFMDWLDEQDREKNYPEFHTRSRVSKDGGPAEYAQSCGRKPGSRPGTVHDPVSADLF